MATTATRRRRTWRRPGGGRTSQTGFLYRVYCAQAQEGRDQGEGGAQGAQQDRARPHGLQDPGLHLPRVKIRSKIQACDVTQNVVFYPKFGAICRPEFDGNPTIVEVNIYVRSMGQVDEAKSLFTLDIYFR